MTFRVYPPDARLRGWVRNFWEAENDKQSVEQNIHTPKGAFRLMFHHGESYHSLSGKLEAQPALSLLGVKLAPIPVMHLSLGSTKTLGVELYPWAGRQLFGADLPNSLNPMLEHERVAREVNALLGLAAWPEAREVVVDWLGRLIAAGGYEQGTGVRAALELYGAFGQTHVGDLAQALNLSPRQLERRFVSEVGLSAKTLARLIRFEETFNRLALEPGTSLAALSFDLGFADQAHLTREFRAFSQMTPKTFTHFSELRQRAEPPRHGSKNEVHLELMT